MKKLIVLCFISLLSLSLLTSCADNTHSEDNISDSDSKEDSGNFIAEEQVFSGLDEQQQIGMGNTQLNCKGGKGIYYFCNSGDTVYFTNFNDNSYIYMLKDNESALVVEKSACCLNYYNGKLYFLSSDFDPADSLRYRGQIYSFDFENNECRMLLDKDVTNMLVTDDGIYYLQLESESDNSSTCSSWIMDFDGTASKRNYSSNIRYGKYVLEKNGAYDIGQDKFTADKENGFIAFPADKKPLKYCVYDNMFVTMSHGGIDFLDLRSGDIKAISDSEISALFMGEDTALSDFTIIDNMVYITINSSVLIRKNMTTDEISLIPIQEMPGETISDLYTDGKRLYGVACTITGGAPKIVMLKEAIDEELLCDILECEVLN